MAPLLDVDELFIDPDLVDTITIIRGVETVDTHGDSQVTQTTLAGVLAVVVPNSGQTLVLLDDGSRISDSITVYSRHQLKAATATRVADRVAWNKNLYLVKMSRDYSRFGEGFYVAICEMLGENPGQELLPPCD